LAIKGEKYGGFALERRLGTGSAGEVWRAREGERAAAVKLYTAPEAAEVFRATGLPTTPDHENVCRVLGGDPAANPPWIATDYVEGPTLRELLLTQRYVPLSAAIPAILQALRGLSALHKERLAHWDLRPENLHFDERGRMRLADVSTEAAAKERLARLFDKKHARPLAPERAARLAPYVAPELRKPAAWAGPLDGPRADMFAFGVLAYEALCGERPSEGFDLKTPSQRDKRVPKVLDVLILGCLERTTRMRLPSALGEEAKLLDGLSKQGFEVFPSGDPSGWVRGTPWRKAGAHVGEETGRFTTDFKRLAQEKGE
jgi:serine/threonine-protein kinase